MFLISVSLVTQKSCLWCITFSNISEFVVILCKLAFNSTIINNVIAGSPVRSMASDDEDDLFSCTERDYGDEFLMEWARVSIKCLLICFTLI